jgi:hypothetical protein
MQFSGLRTVVGANGNAMLNTDAVWEFFSHAKK